MMVNWFELLTWVGLGYGVEKTNLLVVAGSTVIPASVSVSDGFALSVAVMPWVPAVLRVAAKVPVPLIRMASFGRVAWPSVDVKWTVPV